jgi:protoheme IX farnesyltransferase
MRLRTWALWATISTFVVIVLGAYVVKIGAGQSCEPGSWPICNGKVLPPFRQPNHIQGAAFTQHQIVAEWLHRFFVGVTSLLTIGLVVAARKHRNRTDLWTLSIASLGLLFAQVLMGAATVRLGNAPWTVVIHQGLAISFFGVLVAILTLSWKSVATTKAVEAAMPTAATVEKAATSGGPLQTLRDYVTLTKPRVLMLLLVSAATSMFIAAGTHVHAGTVAATLLGGAMASAAGSSFNQWWERDLDRMMVRTANRPVASGRLRGSHVLAFSASLALGSFMVLSVFVNLLAACLALAGGLFYVLVYTIWLKRMTPQNIVIGGAAGSFPALVGWAAATGQIAWPALVLGFIIFLWTPPHFWSLALVYKQDYARASVPMMPVARGDEVTRQQIFLYSVCLFLCATSLYFFGVVSDAWFLFSCAFSGLFVVLAFLLLRDATTKSAYRLFRFSILYLGVLFISLAVDRIVSTSNLL